MRRILVIEDDSAISGLISYNLKQEKFDVTKTATGEEGLRIALAKTPDLIILDIMLPGMGGLDVCRRLKSDGKTRNIPIIILTAKSEEIDRIVGFEVGADDYVAKPFSPRELVLRVKAVLKRNSAEGANEGVLNFKDMTVDPVRHVVSIGGKELQVTLMEFKLLYYFLKNRDKVVSRDMILNNVWGYSAEVFSRTADTHIARLREKIGKYSKYLRAVRGIGYMWGEERP